MMYRSRFFISLITIAQYIGFSLYGSFLSLCLCFCLSLNGHFPGTPGLAGIRMSAFWILLELRVMEVVVTAGTRRMY